MKLTTVLLSLMTLSATGYVSALPSNTEPPIGDVGGLPTTVSSPQAQPPPKAFRSNAERIQRGLPLNPPHRRSGSLVAREPTPSPAPGTTGMIYVMSSSQSNNGYVSSTLDEEGRYFVTRDVTQALTVRIRNHELIPSNGNNQYPRVGTTFGEAHQARPGGPGENAFDVNSYNFAALTGTGTGEYREIAHSGRTSYVPAPKNFIEPAIFTLEPQSKEILVTWINPDSTPRPATFGTSGAGSLHPLFVSSDMKAFNDIYGGAPAKLFLVS